LTTSTRSHSRAEPLKIECCVVRVTQELGQRHMISGSLVFSVFK
jgi:hypothetical protein